MLAERAFFEISHYLRTSHLKLQNILKDKSASDNDKYVATTLLKNANVAAGGILPMCQDTGTAIVLGKKVIVFLQMEKILIVYLMEF